MSRLVVKKREKKIENIDGYYMGMGICEGKIKSF